MPPMPTPYTPQDTVVDARIRSISDFSPQLKTQDTEQLKTIRQRQQQLNSRPVPEPEAVGLGEGLRVQPRLSLTPSPSGGTVSMATCSDTSSSSKWPWRYTHCPKSLMTSLSRSGRR